MPSVSSALTLSANNNNPAKSRPTFVASHAVRVIMSLLREIEHLASFCMFNALTPSALTGMKLDLDYCQIRVRVSDLAS